MRLDANVSSDLLVTQDPDPQARNVRIAKVLRTLGERSTLRHTKAAASLLGVSWMSADKSLRDATLPVQEGKNRIGTIFEPIGTI